MWPLITIISNIRTYSKLPSEINPLHLPCTVVIEKFVQMTFELENR